MSGAGRKRELTNKQLYHAGTALKIKGKWVRINDHKWEQGRGHFYLLGNTHDRTGEDIQDVGAWFSQERLRELLHENVSV